VSPAAADGGARRPLNPFLSKDPNQRAKRLARALVSDIITYHPAKHAEGLRDGTLKQLFRDEIKKSFEEYIAQVGQQLAESTTYFQEALNEVLGAGKKIF
jgi:L-amino acid N-acyltransferase YncA